MNNVLLLNSYVSSNSSSHTIINYSKNTSYSQSLNPNKKIWAFAILLILAFNNLLSAQITGTNNTLVDGSGSDPQTVSTSINLPSGVITSAANISVSIVVNHKNLGDVTATLSGPCGSTILFSEPIGGTGSSTYDLTKNGSYVFSNTGASFPISSNNKEVNHELYAGNFNGLTFPCNYGGNWTITLSTKSGGDNQKITLNSWSITVTSTVKKQLYLSDPSQSLDRIDPVATNDLTTVISPVITPGSSVTVNLIATKDTGIKLKKSDKNYGSCTAIEIDREATDLQRALFQFDLSSIPTGAIIQNAELQLNCISGADMDVSVIKIGSSDSWDEGNSCDSNNSSNWDYRTASSNWSAIGAIGPDHDSGTPEATINAKDTGIQTWPLTCLVKEWVSGISINNGIVVGSQDGGGDRIATYDTRETTSGVKPTLQVTYTTGGISFNQSPSFCSPFTIKGGSPITVTNYVDIVTGTMPTNPDVTAVLKTGCSNIIITLTNPTYNSGTGILTWTGTLASDVTIPAGDAINLFVSSAESGVGFSINYDSKTKPSKIEFETPSYININSHNVYDAPYPGGSLITSAGVVTPVYVRTVVTDPFGFEDITSLELNIAGSLVNVTSVSNTSCTRTYEYNWNTPTVAAIYSIPAKAKEGYENTVTHEMPLTFEVTGGFDSDGDGVLDGIDIDDDNDGILDTLECPNIVNPPLLDPDFESVDIVSSGLDGGPTDVTPTTGLWKGDANNIPFWQSADPVNNYLEIWSNSQTAGNDVGGQAYTGNQWAEINASTNDGLYQDIVSTPGDILQWSFAHRKRTGYAGSATEDIARLMIGDPNGTMSSQGDFASANNASWTNHSGTYVVPPGQTTTRLTFTWVNSVSGSPSSGNFVDNVQLFVIPNDCADTDGDSIPDYFDLDSDNDGIPDIVEAGLGSISAGTGKIPLSVFIDNNNNGMHDAFEQHTPLDSDGDGTPNYLDLDSDNDGVFDVDEARTERYVFSELVFENGDGDVTGDGVGDGTDSEAFRERDFDGNGILDYFGDGILDIYDYGTGANEFGNLSQGTSPLFIKDTDNDGIPDYIDTTSDGSTFDISHTHYADLDANNDGLIDDNYDSDGDGILDLFDTNDAVFGSPRDLEGKFDLFFDGRNDFAEDINFINGWNEATIMAWIKIDPTASGTQVIVGQNTFYLQLNADKSISAIANGNTATNGVGINTNQWTHIAATYSNNNGLLKLYINGEDISSTEVSGALSADSSNFTIGRKPNTNSNYFKGYLDEIRVFLTALSTNELQKMVYQEIESNGNNTKGLIIPLDVDNLIDTETNIPLAWSNLKRYYRMDGFKDDILDDFTTPSADVGLGAKIYNIKIIDTQTAPLPFVTKQSGRLNAAVNDPDNGINGDDAINNNSAIVKIEHNDVFIDSELKQLGLFINQQDASSNPILFEVKNDSELNVSWYLKLDGKIDLEGESQLVQGQESVLDPTSSGTLEKDQQGTADTYTYNYWSSPVGYSNSTSNNNSYSLPDVFSGLNFLSSGYNGSASPLAVADYWIWKYSNQQSDNYSKWQHVRSTGSMIVGEGFTMKGPGTGSILTPQNYVLEGKPNNGTIELTINAGNDYLVGNPYPSSIDANKFITDNGPTIAGADVGANINGTLYFWEHWGGGSHNLSSYQGGYATYSLSGGVPAAAKGTNDPDVGTGGTPTKTPGRYIPVAQGFFVTAENGGTIEFNNSQRVFQIEDGTNSVFTKSTNESSKKSSNSNTVISDERTKLRLGFNSVNTIHRQLLVTIDDAATPHYDWGYDAPYIDSQMDDMYWVITDKKYTIQGIDEINASTILPLGIHTKNDGLNTITIDKLENAPEDLNIYLHDKELEIYHDLKQSDYEVHLFSGQYLNRFEITFSKGQTLGTKDVYHNIIEAYFSNEKNKIVIHNPNSNLIESIQMFNILGQSLFKIESNTSNNHIEYNANQINTGNYILKIETEFGIISKKVLVE
ncbi:LamG-like jellyroll fold domain-containing protein [Algibacter luteus]|uniref:Por secretion system C-terminal sorting domain-containing protein n=1 Tax=Algibacter luteus TaxID=1178825 RepID=A0A1M6GFJ7_9FLAO|nr:LamG-like jellyroll fold domain-containing protein [Algibacter luteus]SHJ08745.1 Por secretion system C-terminal sorting domain-containing protein [Algibacter luteus]